MNDLLLDRIRKKIQGRRNGYLLKWCFRVHEDTDVTALYNDTYLLVIPTGDMWRNIATLISPYKDEREGGTVIVFAEKGTRLVDVARHSLIGRVVSEEIERSREKRLLTDEQLEGCHRGTKDVFIDGTDSRMESGWLPEMIGSALRGITSEVLEKPGSPLFPTAWLVCSTKTQLKRRKYLRGHTRESIPADHEFVSKGPRICLPYRKWYGVGVVAYEPTTAGGWFWQEAPDDGVVTLDSPCTEVRLG